jgi:hypothetical protein
VLASTEDDMSDTPDTPAAPPGDAAGPRAEAPRPGERRRIPENPKPGDRYIEQSGPDTWDVMWLPEQIPNLYLAPQIVYDDLPEADARLMAFGGRVVDALEVFARYADVLDENRHPDQMGIGYYRETSPTCGDCRAARLALAAVRPAGS